MGKGATLQMYSALRQSSSCSVIWKQLFLYFIMYPFPSWSNVTIQWTLLSHCVKLPGCSFMRLPSPSCLQQKGRCTWWKQFLPLHSHNLLKAKLSPDPNYWYVVRNILSVACESCYNILCLHLNSLFLCNLSIAGLYFWYKSSIFATL